MEPHYRSSASRTIGQKACRMQPQTPLEDSQTETDELFVNAGERRGEHLAPADPRVVGATSDEGRGLTTTTVCLWSARLVGGEVMFGCGWLVGRRRQCWRRTPVGLPVHRSCFHRRMAGL